MNYLGDLRKIVGHIPLIAAGATIIVLNSSHEILLNLRSDTKTWGIPGGAMELGESLDETAKRELHEETGLIAEQLDFLTVLSGKEYYFEYPNGDQLYSVIALFLAGAVSGKLFINDDESDELRYFNLRDLPLLESRSARIIDWFKDSHYYTGPIV